MPTCIPYLFPLRSAGLGSPIDIGTDKLFLSWIYCSVYDISVPVHSDLCYNISDRHDLYDHIRRLSKPHIFVSSIRIANVPIT